MGYLYNQIKEVSTLGLIMHENNLYLLYSIYMSSYVIQIN